MTDSTKKSARDPRQEFFGKQIADIDLEIARQAMLCKIPLTDRSLILRVLSNDVTVCGKQNPKAFEKLRALLTMHMGLRDKAIESIGPRGSARDDRGHLGWASPSPRNARKGDTLTRSLLHVSEPASATPLIPSVASPAGDASGAQESTSVAATR